MTHIDQLILEIKSELSNYDALNKIDDYSLYEWTIRELKRFGNLVCVDSDDVVELKKGVGTLPENLHAIMDIERCEPLGYEYPKEKKSHLQNSRIWMERIERSQKWNSCDFCCKEEEEKTIVENYYVDDISIKFTYKCKKPIRVVPGPIPNDCLSLCKKAFNRLGDDEVRVQGNKIYANFDGYIYIQYKGIPVDNEGKPYIPDTDLGRVLEYMSSFLTYKIFRGLYLNGEANIEGKVQFLFSEYKSMFREAMSDAKESKYDLSVYSKMLLRNKIKMLTFENRIAR